MAAKFILVLCVSLFSVVFAMPQPTGQMEPKENMKPAETSHFFSLGLGLGGPAMRYSPYYGYRSGLGIGLGMGYNPYYNMYGGYLGDHAYGYHY